MTRNRKKIDFLSNLKKVPFGHRRFSGPAVGEVLNQQITSE